MRSRAAVARIIEVHFIFILARFLLRSQCDLIVFALLFSLLHRQSACPHCSTVIATGHSLGAALAALFILDTGAQILITRILT